jgi:hypothetical protein
MNGRVPRNNSRRKLTRAYPILGRAMASNDRVAIQRD